MSSWREDLGFNGVKIYTAQASKFYGAKGG